MQNMYCNLLLRLKVKEAIHMCLKWFWVLSKFWKVLRGKILISTPRRKETYQKLFVKVLVAENKVLSYVSEYFHVFLNLPIQNNKHNQFHTWRFYAWGLYLVKKNIIKRISKAGSFAVKMYQLIFECLVTWS